MGAHFSFSQVFARLRLLLCAALFLLAPARPQQPADSANGKLASVSISGSKRYASQLIAPETGLSAGSNITKADLQNGADRLAQLGLFSNVQYRYATEDAGVRAEYQVTDAATLPVWFDNFPWFTDEEISAALRKDVPLFDGTAPESGSILHEITAALARLLATRGVHADVTNAIANAPVTDRRIQQFHVENAGVSISTIEFSDALARDDRGIHQRLADVVGQPYSRTLVELFEFEQVRPVYLAHGFLRVRFGEPAARVAGSGVAAKATVAATVEPGPAFAFDGVSWTGNRAVSTAVLNSMVTLKTGDSVDGVKLEAMWDAARDEYATMGYLDMKLTPSPQFDDAARRVTYNVSISEGPQYHMGKLVLTGLSIEGEKRIRAAWGIAPGAVFNKDIYDEFVDSGIKQAFAGLPFHYDKVGRFLQQDAGNGVVDVMLDFQ